MLEAKAQARYVRLAPRKARDVVNLILKKDIDEALSILFYTPRRAAAVITKVVKSAVANAENNLEMDRSKLYVERAYVDEGPTLKRVQPRARGRRFMILKRTSHITVVVKEREGA